MLDISRHKELFNAEKFDKKVTIIGAGATGSWLALSLAKLGIQDITVYDFDIVEEHNIANQLYAQGVTASKHQGDTGRLKVDALYEHVMILSGGRLNIKPIHFTNQPLTGIVFLMVDTMKTRKEIWEASIKGKPYIDLLIEPRMGLDVGRVYNVEPYNLTHIKEYEDTYYSDDMTEVSACGNSMTVISSALGITSWCTRQLINFHNGEELDNEILIDFKYNNIVTTRWC